MMSPSLSLLLMLVAAFQLADAAKEQRNIMTTPKGVGKGVPAKGRDSNLGRASGSLGQTRLPLPPPSNGWIVIMQRFDLSLDFNRKWIEYKHGFGELGLQKEFWLGNDAIHHLTSGVPHKLRVELVTNDTLFYADYDSFFIDSEDKKYTLHVSGYSGNAGDSMTAKGAPVKEYQDGLGFSTLDVDNDNATGRVCTSDFQAAWWFNNCYWACLTCPAQQSFRWRKLEDLGLSGYLIGARMRVTRK